MANRRKELEDCTGAFLLRHGARLCVRWLLLLAVAVIAPAHAGNDVWEPFRAVRGVTVQSDDQMANIRFATYVARDTSGRMWMGGYAKLVRLDGERPKIYSGNRTPPFTQGYVRMLLPLDDGGMLVATNREGVVRWDPSTGRFNLLEVADGIRLTRINSLSRGAGGGVWIGAEKGLFHWSGRAADKATRVTTPALEQIESPRIFSTLERSDGSLWVAAHTGIWVRGRGQEEFAPLSLAEQPLQERLAAEGSWLLSEDDRQRVWIGMLRSGVVVVDTQRGRSFAPEGLDGIDGLHGGRTIRTFLWSQGRMWIGTEGEGLLGCADTCTKAERVPVNLGSYEGERNFVVRALTTDPHGRIWAASDRGVFHFQPQANSIIELNTALPGVEGRSHPTGVRSLYYERARNRVWVGMEGGFVQVLDLRHGRRHVVWLPQPLAGSLISGISADDSGRLWAVGTGVAWIDPDTLQVTLADALSRAPVRRVNHLVIDGDRAWLALYDGVAEVDMAGKVLRRLEGTRTTGLQSAYVTSLGKSSSGLWAATQDGLYRIDLDRWQAERVVEPSVPNEGRSAVSFVNGLAVSAQAAWVGSAMGIWQVDAVSPQLRPAAFKGVYSGEIAGVATTSGNELWFASSLTLGRLGATGEVVTFGAREGYFDSAIARNGMIAGPDGTVLLGTQLGVTVVRPQLLELVSNQPPDLSPAITALQRDGVWQPEGSLPVAGDTLLLPPTHERLVVEFSAIDYLVAGRQHYAYRLEGHDTLWTELDQRAAASAMYSRIPAGNYSLALRIRNDAYPGQEWISRYPLIVQPYWYERTSVRVVAALLTLVGLGLLVWLRDVRARRRRRRLEQLVNRRTHELRQANARLDKMVGEDVLTGLYNRRRLFERLEELHADAGRHQRVDTLVLLDLDNFKQINDGHGHLVGDEVLREVARRVSSSLRVHDLAGRYGGEELMVVLPDTSLDEAREPVARLWQVIRAAPVQTGTLQLPVTASLGVAQSVPGQSVEAWIARADAALYQAKAQGRDRIQFDG